MNCLDREKAKSHKKYYDQFIAGNLQLIGANRIAICSAEPDEIRQNPNALYYLLDGVGRSLPYMVLVLQKQPVPKPIEAFVAERV
jgi:hypothetical protein